QLLPIVLERQRGGTRRSAGTELSLILKVSCQRQPGAVFTSYSVSSAASEEEEPMEPGFDLQSGRDGELYCQDSAYGSSVLDTDTEEGHTPSSNNIIYYNEELLHKTILVGDSGVGKTSLLVQFDQGKFIPGSFSATVGIGFTEGRYGLDTSVTV
ncbi:hypothetical protein chiPu_0013321, partial [Chiloscyllium punctatum]|nr:hypothetical protein [Chiloscyllium punctatum]